MSIYAIFHFFVIIFLCQSSASYLPYSLSTYQASWPTRLLRMVIKKKRSNFGVTTGHFSSFSKYYNATLPSSLSTLFITKSTLQVRHLAIPHLALRLKLQRRTSAIWFAKTKVSWSWFWVACEKDVQLN